MADVLKIIFDLIIWIFVPVILITVIWFLAFAYKRTEIKRQKSALQAGFWAGLMLSVIFLIYQVNIFLKIGFPQNDIFQGFKLWLSLTSALVVFILALGGKKIISPALSGWLNLLFTSISLSAFFHYIFIRTYNDVLLSVILGAAFGFLTHLAASPSSLKEFFGHHQSTL